MTEKKDKVEITLKLQIHQDYMQQVTDKTLSHNVVSSTPRHERDSNSQH